MPLTEIAQDFELPLPAEQAIDLFTPKGEEAWVPDWKPRYIWPRTGETRREMLFITGAGADSVIWTCLAWEPDLGHARYQKIMAPALVIYVDVRARPIQTGRSSITVTYSYAPLSPAGERVVADIDREAHRAALARWPAMLRAAGLLASSEADGSTSPETE